MDINASSSSGADIDISSLGNILLQAWQDILFISLEDSLSFTTDYNITLLTQDNNNGDISFISTRDIDQTIDDITSVFTHDYLLDGNTIELFTHDDFDFIINGLGGSFLSLSSDSSFLTAGTDINIASGISIFVSLESGIFNIGDNFDITTTGLHNLITFNAGDAFTLTSNNLDLSTDVSSILGDEALSSRNGNGFIIIGSAGDHPTDGYSSQYSIDGNINFDSPLGSFNMISNTFIDINTSDFISISGTSDDIGIYINALDYFDGIINITTSENTISIDSNEYLTFEARDLIHILPFDDLSFSSRDSSNNIDYDGMLLQSNHESSDIIIFTTDFLTADITFDSEDIVVYSEDSSTFLLLDDDDTLFVGTFQFSAGSSINAAAENNLIIRETSSGDISFEDSNGEFFFSAGNNLSLLARQLFEFDTGNIAITSERDVNYNAVDIEFNLDESFSFQADGNIKISARDDILITADNNAVSFTLYDANQDSEADANREIFILSDTDVNIFGDLLSVNLPPHRIVDFRDGLRIPSNSLNIETGDACTVDRELVYDTTQDRICFCGNLSFQCLDTQIITFFG